MGLSRIACKQYPERNYWWSFCSLVQWIKSRVINFMCLLFIQMRYGFAKNHSCAGCAPSFMFVQHWKSRVVNHIKEVHSFLRFHTHDLHLLTLETNFVFLLQTVFQPAGCDRTRFYANNNWTIWWQLWLKVPGSVHDRSADISSSWGCHVTHINPHLLVYTSSCIPTVHECVRVVHFCASWHRGKSILSRC